MWGRGKEDNAGDAGRVHQGAAQRQKEYRDGEEVKIVCICHGSLLTPLEFVQHAGAGNGKVDNPLRHIVMSPTPTL
jgi:hypothetical protein